ncbi:MAG: hypothetical protein AB1724_03860 [Thermodesulfobacteriota bacterium]
MKYPLFQMAGLFFVSAALLALEICLARIFSTMIWFHFSFLAIGIAMMGFAFAGILLVVFRKSGTTAPTAATDSLKFALAIGLGTVLLLFQSPCLQALSSIFTSIGCRIVFAVILITVFTTAFTFAGLSVSTIISGNARDIGRFYGANLTGAGAGAMLVLPLLSAAGALDAVLIILLMALCGAICLMLSRPQGARRGLAACVLTATVTIVVMGMTDGNTPFAESLLTRQDVTRENRIFRKWNSFSCVDFYTVDKNLKPLYLYREPLWGLSLKYAYQGELPELVKIIIDSWAVTATYKIDQTTLEMPFYDYLPTNLAYQLLSHPSVLVLGAGGGGDILSALHYKASSITGVEINPSIVSSVKNELADFSGNIYNRPDVPVHVAEGRHWLSRDRSTYDLIHLSGVDSLSGALSGAYCFSESYLYTIEAFSEYLTHLTDDGIVTFLRFAFTPPMEMLRLFTTATEALGRHGINDPERHLMVVHSNVGLFAVLLMKKSPFTPEQIRAIDTTCQDKGFSLLYSPDRQMGNAFYAFVESSDKSDFCKRYPFKIAPVTDNSPFFFNYAKLSTVFKPPDPSFFLYFVGQMVLYGGFFVVLAFSSVFILWPAAIYRKRKVPVKNARFIILYFTGIGIAFMLVENLFIQKYSLFLGQPVYSLALVLFCALVFAGAGSYWSGTFQKTRHWRALVSWGLPAFPLATFFGSDAVFPALLHTGLFTRVMVSVAMLAPCCFLMGMLFPWGIRRMEKHAPQAIPWAWALNSYASVLGAFLAVIGGITLGFAATCLIAAVLYAFCGFMADEQKPGRDIPPPP